MLWVCKKYTYLHLYYTQRKETSRIVHNVRFRYGGANKKTGGGAGDAESEQDLETKSGRRRRGRPQRRFMDVVKKGMKRAGVTKENDAWDV